MGPERFSDTPVRRGLMVAWKRNGQAWAWLVNRESAWQGVRSTSCMAH